MIRIEIQICECKNAIVLQQVSKYQKCRLLVIELKSPCDILIDENQEEVREMEGKAESNKKDEVSAEKNAENKSGALVWIFLAFNAS